MDTKKCSSCSESKSVLDFHKDKKGKFGVRANCKSCRNNEAQRAKRRDWYHRNKEERQKKIKEYSLSYGERRKQLHKERQSKDINYRIKRALRSRLYSAIKNNSKQASAVKDIGCSIEFFKSYIESKFKINMTWDNYGVYWHIDHRISVKHFVDKGVTNSKVINALSNLKPLHALDNLRKSSKIETRNYGVK